MVELHNKIDVRAGNPEPALQVFEKYPTRFRTARYLVVIPMRNYTR